MAYKTQYQGTSVQGLLSTDWKDINNMSKKELWDLSRQSVIAANKRVANITKRFGAPSPGVQKFLDAGGGKVSINMTPNQMRTQIKNLRQFLSPATSDQMTTRTVAGYKKYLKEYNKMLGDVQFQTPDGNSVAYSDLTEDQRRSMWNFIDRARSELDYGTSKYLGSEPMIAQLATIFARAGTPAFDKDGNLLDIASEEELKAARDRARDAYQASLGDLEEFVF